MQATRNPSQETEDSHPLDPSLEESKTINDKDQDETPPKTPKSSNNEANQDSSSLNTKWKGVFGYDDIKQTLIEEILLPTKFPQLFTGFRNKHSILLYGPAGVGKTRIVKAAAEEFNFNIFILQAADFMSKHLGDPERLLKETFQAAKEKQPAIIFIDDIDYLFSSRQDHGSEGRRRVKTEFLIEYENLPKDGNVFVIGAGNRPWDLDLAVKKRFVKKIYLKLPDLETRKLLLKDQFSTISQTELSSEDLNQMASQTDGYSCSDLICLARDMIYQPLRELTKATHFRSVETLSSGEVVYEPCQQNDKEAKEMSFQSLTEKELKIRPIGIEDFKLTLSSMRPSIPPEEVTRYENFYTETHK